MKQDQSFLKSYTIREQDLHKVASLLEDSFTNDYLRISILCKTGETITLLEHLDKIGAIKSINRIESLPPKKVSKARYDKEENTRKKLRIGEDFYLAELVCKVSKNGHYESFQAQYVYPTSRVNIVTHTLFNQDHYTMKARLDTSSVSARYFDKYTKELESKPTYTDKNNQPRNHMLYEQFSSRLKADSMKEVYAHFMGGYTYADVTADKDAMYIYSGKHINHHSSQQVLSLWRLYVQSLIGSFESYCFSGILSQCVSCGSCSTKEEIHHIIKENHPDANSHLIEVVKTNVAKRKDTNAMILVKGRILDLEDEITTRIIPRHLNSITLRSIMLGTPDREHVDVVPHINGASAKNTRYNMRPHREEVSAMSGVFYETIPVNSLIKVKEYVEELNNNDLNVRQTKGIIIEGVKESSRRAATNLSSSSYVHIQYTFSNKLRDYTSELLKQNMEYLVSGEKILSTKKRVAKDQFSSKVDILEYDKNKLLEYKVSKNGEGDNVLDVLVFSEGFNPISWIAGLISIGSAPSNSSKFCKIKAEAIEYVFAGGVRDSENTEGLSILDTVSGDSNNKNYDTLLSVWGGEEYKYFD